MEMLKGLFMARVDAFLERTGVAPATLGRQAVGDPNLVRELRDGRSPTLATADQLWRSWKASTRPVWTLFPPGATGSGIHPRENGEAER